MKQVYRKVLIGINKSEWKNGEKEYNIFNYKYFRTGCGPQAIKVRTCTRTMPLLHRQS